MAPPRSVPRPPFGFRYQYLAGGVNTGNGWATWNTNGQFVTYVRRGLGGQRADPGLPVLHAPPVEPATGADEKARDLSNLANTATMAAYYADLRLFFQRAAGPTPVVLHVEPDLWGYIEQAPTARRRDDASRRRSRARGDAALAGLPNNAAGFAQAIVRLRERPRPERAPRLPPLGVGDELRHQLLERLATRTSTQLAARAAAFYESLGAAFDIAFTDIGDRDAGFKQIQYGDGGASWWDARRLRPLRPVHRRLRGRRPASGRRLADPARQHEDAGAEQHAGATTRTTGSSGSSTTRRGTHLAAVARRRASSRCSSAAAPAGTTCACDATSDGVTNPAAINGNTAVSLSADDDGGYFRERAAAYYARGGLTIGTGSDPPPPPPPVAHWTVSGSTKPTTVIRGHPVALTVRVKASVTIRARVQVDVYDAANHRVYSHLYGAYTFLAGATTTYHPGFTVSSSGSGRHVHRQDQDHLGDGRVPRQPPGHHVHGAHSLERRDTEPPMGRRGPCRGTRHGCLRHRTGRYHRPMGGWRSER